MGTYLFHRVLRRHWPGNGGLLVGLMGMGGGGGGGGGGGLLAPRPGVHHENSTQSGIVCLSSLHPPTCLATYRKADGDPAEGQLAKYVGADAHVTTRPAPNEVVVVK